MKIRISLFAMLFMALPMFAQVHITITDSTWSTSELSSLVGQTVIFDAPIVVSSNANGNYTVGPWRRYHPENQGVAGSEEYSTTVRINSATTFSLTGISGYHRCGEKIYNLKAKVNSSNSLSMIDGTWKGDTRSDLESRLPELGDYRILVCAFNLENYFVKNLGPEYLGANSYAEHQQQRKKVSKALKRINADIYGLVEIEQGSDAVQEIVGDLNKNLPDRSYKYIGNSTTSGSSQSAVFVYDSKIVEPINTPVGTDEEVADRKKMVCFREKATGEKFIYSINHFKSMNTGDEYRRFKEAQAVVKLYNDYRKNPHIREEDVLFMGDMNCYAFTRPIKVFTDHGMIDLHRAFHGDSSYSYLFGGLASYIDHAISNETLYRQITGMAAYHINSDEDDKYTYDKSSDETMFRCSDHDPVLVGLKPDSTLSQSFEPYISNDIMASDSVGFYYIYTTTTEDPVIYFDIYTINGIRICPPTRIIYEGDIFESHTKYYSLNNNNPKLPDEVKAFLPLPSGLYILHFYYKGQIVSHKLIVR